MKKCEVKGCERLLWARGLCKRCYTNAYCKTRRATDKTYVAKKNAIKRRWRKNNLEKARASARKHRNKRTGFEEGLEARLVRFQNGRCAICSVSFEKGNGPNALNRDHCHVSIKGRGLLCGTCNRVLGSYEKHIRARVKIEQFEEYLLRPPADEVRDA